MTRGSHPAPGARPFVVAATGRSGTGYTATLLSRCGLVCGHEEVFRITDPGFHGWRGYDGDASWLSVPFLDRLPPETVVFHQVREPLAAIRSLASTGMFLPFRPGRHLLMPILRALRGKRPRDLYRRFVRHHDPASFDEGSELARAAYHWMSWNRRIEESTRAAGLTCHRVHLERLDIDRLNEMLTAIGAPVRSELPALPRTTNSRTSRYPSATWKDLPRGLSVAVRGRAARYAEERAGGSP